MSGETYGNCVGCGVFWGCAKTQPLCSDCRAAISRRSLVIDQQAQRIQKLERWVDEREAEAREIPLGQITYLAGAEVSEFNLEMWLVRQVRAALGSPVVSEKP